MRPQVEEAMGFMRRQVEDKTPHHFIPKCQGILGAMQEGLASQGEAFPALATAPPRFGYRRIVESHAIRMTPITVDSGPVFCSQKYRLESLG